MNFLEDREREQTERHTQRETAAHTTDDSRQTAETTHTAQREKKADRDMCHKTQESTQDNTILYKSPSLGIG